MKRLLGIAREEFETFDGLVQFMPAALELTLPDSVFKKLHFTAPAENLIRWKWESLQCFAYKGMKQIGVIDGYRCGVMYTIQCWLDAGKPFHGNRVSKIRRAYGLKSRCERLRDKGLLTRKELASKQGVHQWRITKWRINGRIKAHLADDQGQYLFEDPGNVCLRLKKKKVKKAPIKSLLLTNVSCEAKEVQYG